MRQNGCRKWTGRLYEAAVDQSTNDHLLIDAKLAMSKPARLHREKKSVYKSKN